MKKPYSNVPPSQREGFWGNKKKDYPDGTSYYHPGNVPGCDVSVFRINPKTREVELLMILRPDDDLKAPNKWGLPGGFQKGKTPLGTFFTPAEEPWECAIRELREETTLDLQGTGLWLLHLSRRDRQNQNNLPDSPRYMDNVEAWNFTHSFAVMLGEETALRPLQAKDDAKEVKWISLRQLPPKNEMPSGQGLSVEEALHVLKIPPPTHWPSEELGYKKYMDRPVTILYERPVHLIFKGEKLDRGHENFTPRHHQEKIPFPESQPTASAIRFRRRRH